MSFTGIGANPYISFMLGGLVEIPSYLMVVLIMDHCGRKPLFSILLILTAVTCIPAGYLDGDAQTAVLLIGNLHCSAYSRKRNNIR